MKCKSYFRELSPKENTIMIVCICGETNEVVRK